jgi:hypothetical protein
MRIEPKATNAAAAKLAVKEFLTKKTTEREIYFYSRFVGSESGVLKSALVH